jgi:hypothetical protein
VRFTPKTSQEIDESSLLDPGLYDFEVIEAEDKTSKAGNDMVAIAIRIEDSNGRGFKVLDWLVGTDGGAYKVRHFAETTGMLAEYEKGDMPAGYMIGKTGRCKITIKPGSGEYRAKNAVADYVPGGALEPVGRTAGVAAASFNRSEIDDEIPF